MVGLVVFVAVFAAGLKDSLTGAIERPVDLVVTSDTYAPVPRAARDRIQHLPAVAATAPQYIDQVEVDGRAVSDLTDMINGVEPLALRDVYRFRWLDGSDDEPSAWASAPR